MRWSIRQLEYKPPSVDGKFAYQFKVPVPLLGSGTHFWRIVLVMELIRLAGIWLLGNAMPVSGSLMADVKIPWRWLTVGTVVSIGVTPWITLVSSNAPYMNVRLRPLYFG